MRSGLDQYRDTSTCWPKSYKGAITSHEDDGDTRWGGRKTHIANIMQQSKDTLNIRMRDSFTKLNKESILPAHLTAITGRISMRKRTDTRSSTPRRSAQNKWWLSVIWPGSKTLPQVVARRWPSRPRHIRNDCSANTTLQYWQTVWARLDTNCHTRCTCCCH